MNPPMGGPRMGPSKAGMVRYDMARTSSDFGTARNRISRPTGSINAPATPCSIRAPTSSIRFCDTPQSSELAAKPTMAARNTLRAPNRSAIQVEMGRNTAADKR